MDTVCRHAIPAHPKEKSGGWILHQRIQIKVGVNGLIGRCREGHTTREAGTTGLIKAVCKRLCSTPPAIIGDRKAAVSCTSAYDSTSSVVVAAFGVARIAFRCFLFLIPSKAI